MPGCPGGDSDVSGRRAVILGCFGLSASAMVRRRLSATKVPFPTAAGVPNHWPTDQSIPGSPPGAPTHRNLRRDTLACPNFKPYDLPALNFSTGTPASPPEGSITLITKPDRRGPPSPADHFYRLTGFPFPHVPGSPAMHNPRSMIHDLAPTAHDSRSAPRSPICNLRCSINDPRITAQSPGTSEINAGSLSHAGIPKLTTVPPLVLPGTPEFTEHRRLQIGDRGADRESGAVDAKSWIMDRGLCIADERRTGGKGIPVSW